MANENLKYALKESLLHLPGEDAHREMFPLRAVSSEALKTAENFRLSGVLALIYPIENNHQIILTERQDYDGNHSSQMSFPGGKIEQSDKDSLDAALRETYEEIGVLPDQVEVLGKLTDVYIPVSNFLVHPYVGYLDMAPSFIINEREVKQIVTFDLTELSNKENRIITDITTGKGIKMKNIPALYISEKIIWGATALMLNELKFVLQKLKTNHPL
ncbi:MAG: CoA pyrophosphatase [Crocinitomicaceae bacterium]|nr:CoA pyrophosphatase [Crocinitomicaceae bacterium]